MAQPVSTQQVHAPNGTRPAPAPEPKRPSARHVHWFRWRSEDAFSGSSLYACRCGQVRPSL
ncbi:hypothetical protein ACI8AG_10690 [Blastococcus sp. SYSU DS0552]